MFPYQALMQAYNCLVGDNQAFCLYGHQQSAHFCDEVRLQGLPRILALYQ